MTSPPSLAADRRARIAALLSVEGRVVASDLSTRLDVSVDTVQRDLVELERRGVLRRVRGGALPPPPHPPEATQREDLDRPAKWQIAAATWRVIGAAPTGVIAVGGGTTAVILARATPAGQRGSAFTPSPEVALEFLRHPGVTTHLSGGELHPQARTLTGPVAVDFFRAIRPDVAVVSACSFDAGAGLTMQLVEEAPVVTAMIAASSRVVVMATTERLATAAAFTVAPASAVDVLVTDAPDAVTAPFASSGIEVVTA